MTVALIYGQNPNLVSEPSAEVSLQLMLNLA